MSSSLAICYSIPVFPWLFLLTENSNSQFKSRISILDLNFELKLETSILSFNRFSIMLKMYSHTVLTSSRSCTIYCYFFYFFITYGVCKKRKYCFIKPHDGFYLNFRRFFDKKKLHSVWSPTATLSPCSARSSQHFQKYLLTIPLTV